MRSVYRRAMGEKRRYPPSKYGKLYVPAGIDMPAMRSDERLQAWGPSWKEANATQRASRQTQGYYGHGLYTGSGGYMRKLRHFGSAVGSAALGAGIAAGRSYMGMGLYQGMGEYEPDSNNLVAGGSGSIPQVSSTGDETGGTIITHREYLADIYAPGVKDGDPVSFQNISFPLNPALQQSFPWLSQIAQNYDEYEFKQLIFTYRSTTTDIGNSTTGQCGTIIMCTNYNAANPKFTDKQQMIEYAHAHSAKLTSDLIHGVECDPSKNAMSGQLYTRSNPVVTGQDLKTYDHGLFQLAIANAPKEYNGFPVGELWVEYTVLLRKPKLFVSRGLEIDLDQFLIDQSGTARLDLPFQGLFLTGQQNNIGCQVVMNGASVAITVPASYTGPLNFRIFIKSENNITVSSTFNSKLTVATTGNFKPILDVYASGAINPNPTNLAEFPIEAGAGAAGLPHGFSNEFHYFVTSATQGINNKITFSYAPVGTLPVTTQVQTFISVSQYQSNGLPEQNLRTTWLNSSGVVTTPILS